MRATLDFGFDFDFGVADLLLQVFRFDPELGEMEETRGLELAIFAVFWLV